jgi:hypothetical protein
VGPGETTHGEPAGDDFDPPFRKPTDTEYERWWRAYHALPDPKSAERLCGIVHTRKSRLQHAIRVGWSGYPALRDRELAVLRTPGAAMSVAVEVEARAIARVAAVIIPKWEEHALKHMAALEDVSETIRHISAELRLASQEATFLAYRRVPETDDEGRECVDERGRPKFRVESYVPAESIARATARLAAAAKDHAILNKALLDSLNPMRDAAIDLSDAPPEALEYIRRKFGHGGPP